MRPERAERPTAQRAAQIVGQWWALAHGEHARTWAGMVLHRRDIAGGEHRLMRQRLQRVVNRDEALRVQLQTRFGKPRRGAGGGHPQDLVQRVFRALCGAQPARRDLGHDRIACKHLHMPVAQHALERAARARHYVRSTPRRNRRTARRRCDHRSGRAYAGSWRSRYCTASSISTPPAPVPTTPMRTPLLRANTRAIMTPNGP